MVLLDTATEAITGKTFSDIQPNTTVHDLSDDVLLKATQQIQQRTECRSLSKTDTFRYACYQPTQ